MERHGTMLFALEAARDYGERLAAALRLPLSRHEEREFADGEHKSRPLDPVAGRRVCIVHSLYGDDGQSVDGKLCRLLFFIAAVRDAGAARITAVLPYLCYARKDRKTRFQDPVTVRYLAALLETAGIDGIVTLDTHNPAAYHNAFRCPSEHLQAAPLFAAHLAAALRGDPLVVVAPDAGGVKRAQDLRAALEQAGTGAPGAAFMEKHRAGDRVTAGTLMGDVADKTAVIVDDLIGTGATLSLAARACRRGGAGRVVAAATHGLFVGGAPAALREVDQVVVTDTVPAFRLRGSEVAARLTTLPSAGLFAAALRAGGAA